MIGFMVNYSKKRLTFQEAKSFLQDDWSIDNMTKKYVVPAPPSALHLLDIEYSAYGKKSIYHFCLNYHNLA